MTTLIAASCHCGKNKFQIPFTTSSLPKVSNMCHCNICRHCTGAMSIVDARMDGVPLAPESTEDNRIPGDLRNLTEYRASSMLTRFFCNTCSAHMFFRTNPQDDGSSPTWSIQWGMLERTDGILVLDKHIYLGDTIDGGIADHIRTYAGTPLVRVKEWSDASKDDIPIGWHGGDGEYKSPETLLLYCHCKSVNLYLTRPTKPSDNPEDYWIVPGKEPSDPIRFIAAHCLCNSCRQCTGGQIQTWVVVPDDNIFDAATKVPVNLVDSEKRPKGLKQYISSEGHHRESCRTCGATVFWWRTMKEGESPHMDVSAGLIDQNAAGGARAETWVSWYNRPMFDEFAISKHTAKAVKDGLKEALGGGGSD